MAIPAEKVGFEKVAEKLVEKRRALGRGLESLLPRPRVVPANDPTLAPSTRKDGAPSGVSDATTALPESVTADESAGDTVAGAADGEARAMRSMSDQRLSVRRADVSIGPGT